MKISNTSDATAGKLAANRTMPTEVLSSPQSCLHRLRTCFQKPRAVIHTRNFLTPSTRTYANIFEPVTGRSSLPPRREGNNA